MTYLLASGLIAATAALLTVGYWYHAANSTIAAFRDRLDAAHLLGEQYRGERDTLKRKLDATEDALATEQQRRAVAEAQRNEAMKRARAYLTRPDASPTEIDRAVADLFQTPLSALPGNELEKP